jgi:Tn3 transposase DDE domain-containing protein
VNGRGRKRFAGSRISRQGEMRLERARLLDVEFLEGGLGGLQPTVRTRARATDADRAAGPPTGALTPSCGRSASAVVLIKNTIVVCWNYLLLQHRLDQASTDELRAEIRDAVANHSAISWEHVNLLGEYDFSDEKLQDSVGIPPPKTALKSQARIREQKPA